MPPFVTLSPDERRRRIAQAGTLESMLLEPDGRAILEAEADDPEVADEDRLIRRDELNLLLRVREHRDRDGARLRLFFSTDDVIVVPGFMGSDLRDEAAGGHGLIWIDPGLVLDGGQLNALKLAPFRSGQPDRDEAAGVRIESRGAVPVIYDLLRATLEVIRYSVSIYPVDWRKDLDRSAVLLADRIRARLSQRPRPLHLIAHSQGTLVARRALQILGAVQSRALVKTLVLLGPATFGTYSAALALSGNHPSLEMFRRFRVRVPDGFERVLRSFTGLYQLLPWNPALEQNGSDRRTRERSRDRWGPIAEADRLEAGFGFGSTIDTSFFNDRTAILLGDRPTVRDGVVEGGVFRPSEELGPGDGTVPDELAMLPGVRTYRVPGADHMSLPMNPTVINAVRVVLNGGTPGVERLALAGGRGRVAGPITEDEEYLRRLRRLGLEPPVTLPAAETPPPTAAEARRAPPPGEEGVPAAGPTPGRPAAAPAAPPRPEPPRPPYRRLRVFSFDPLLAGRLDALEIAEMTLKVPWESEIQLAPGPVGEYVEVVDYDPASRAFYPPVDLSHPRLLASDGLAPSESNPQFHQQMVYAVAMSTIATFEQALGRSALWAPRPWRAPDTAAGEAPMTAEQRYVPRLRIYPHALREDNAFYDPERHALLFGYFPSREEPGGETLPGGTIFSCLSFDIVAHETAHALLHGLHPYFMEPSNPDVRAFHEAFSDVVALFQHFAQPEVVANQVARTRGDFRRGALLGQLARQFGAALGGGRGALRRYVDTGPDPGLYRTVTKVHDRGAILVAALFRAFINIFENRSRDLYRIATGGTGVLPDGALHPDLVRRLAVEASKSAEHLLNMCIRALDYIPPVDLTFGEYLRALITADYDLVHDDDLRYRVAVIEAFRDWGLYPSDVNVLDQSALLWRPPDEWDRDALRDKVRQIDLGEWKLHADRRDIYLRMERNRLALRSWLYRNARETPRGRDSLGVLVFGKEHRSIPRNERNAPIFHVASIRPSRRIGPDGQYQVDLVAEVVQRRAGYLDPKVQERVDGLKEGYWAFDEEQAGWKNRRTAPPPDFWFQGGSTLIIDPESGEVRYCIKKSIIPSRSGRMGLEREHRRTAATSDAINPYFGSRVNNPFAMLHADE